MTITIELNKNKWLLEIVGKHNGRGFRKRFRNKTKIKNIIEQLENPDTVFMGINDMKISYDEYTVVLKDYRKNKKRYLFKKIVNSFPPETKIVNVLASNIDKFKKATKKGFVAMAFSLAVANSVIPQQSVKASDTIIQAQSIIKTPLVIEKESDFNIEETMSLDNRISEIENLESIENNGKFNVCSKLNEYTLNKMVSYFEEHGDVYINASLKYGVDPYLLLAMSMTETSLLHEQTIPGGAYYNGSAIGAMQIEKSHIGDTVTAYNYQTNSYDTVEITQDKLVNLESNVEIGAMQMQNHLNEYNNNVYIAIQAHNYGTTAMDKIIDSYSNEIGKTREEVISNMEDFGWMKYVDDVHNNPKKYFPTWKNSTYGNNYYLYSVMGYYLGQNIVNNSKDSYYIYDLVSNTCIVENKMQKQLMYKQILEKVSSEFLDVEETSFVR